MQDSLPKLLEAIADSPQGSHSLKELCMSINANEEFVLSVVDTVLPILKVFDVVEVSEPNGVVHISVQATSARYFLKSLAAFIYEGKSIVTNWNRRSIYQSKTEEFRLSQIANGPQFLSILEKIRTTLPGSSNTIRSSKVVKGLIISKSGRKPENKKFLVQCDNDTPQYQLIGGHMQSSDPDLITAMRRELEEELNQKPLTFNTDYQLVHFHSGINFAQVSPSYGAYTNYELHYYLIKIDTKSIKLGPRDRWVSLEELLKGETLDGTAINEKAIVELNKKLVGGLKSLPLSDEHISSISLTNRLTHLTGPVMRHPIGATVIGGLVVAFLTFLFGWSGG